MASGYPNSIDRFTNPSGTQTQNSPDHAGEHSDANDAIFNTQTVLGTTAGTSVLKNFAAGNFPARINSSNVLQQNLQGTLNNSVIGTPAITGGTATSFVGTDSTNNFSAKSIKSATTTVDVSGATAPSSGQVLTATSSTAATWQAVPANAVTSAGTIITADGTTASSSYVDLASASVSVTAGTSGKVLLFFKGSAKNGATDQTSVLAYSVDAGVDVPIMYVDDSPSLGNRAANVSFQTIVTGLSNASHAFKIRWKVTGGTATMLGATYGYEVGALAL